MLDDTNKPTIIRKSSKLISNDIKWNTEKTLYTKILQENLPDPMDINEEFINNALELYRDYGVLYNPHLDGKEFIEFIKKCIEIKGNKANLNWIDTSAVTNMSYVFNGEDFNGDISEWDVSNVKFMGLIFYGSKFNLPIDKWNVSNVLNFRSAFLSSEFNQDISNWKINKYCMCFNMFKNAKLRMDYRPVLL